MLIGVLRHQPSNILGVRCESRLLCASRAIFAPYVERSRSVTNEAALLFGSDLVS